MPDDLFFELGDAKGATMGERAQWEFASIMIVCTLLLAALVALVFYVLLWRAGPSRLPIAPAFAMVVLGLIVLLGLAGFGVSAGLRGWRPSPHDHRPASLAIAGVAAGVAATSLWVLVGIDLIAILASFAHWH